mmetsp:Transcript_1942/g.8761  ORF Transcript_1942/g.8761 Transcript_1942/m.8761 type:complete len:293 (+) Transcript_1942:746-1624(+)
MGGPSCANATWISKDSLGPAARTAVLPDRSAPPSKPASRRGIRCTVTGSSGCETRHSPAPFTPARYISGSTLRQFWTMTYHELVTAKSCGAASHPDIEYSVEATSRQSPSHSQKVASTDRAATALVQPQATTRPVFGSTWGCAVNALPPMPSADSTFLPAPTETNMPLFTRPSRSSSPMVSSVSGSNSTGRPASYRAYTLPPHANMFVLARFFWCKSSALRKGPPVRIVPKVPRYSTSSADSSAANSSVRTNLLANRAVRASTNSNRRTYPSPSSMWLYSLPPRSNNPGPLR